MIDTRIHTRGGGEATIRAGLLETLDGSLTGRVLVSGDEDYEASRAIWNAMIDRRPAVIVRCESPEDVARAVRFAREHDLLVSVKGGGHNIAGNAVCEAGVLVDLSRMRDVQVDAAARTAVVGPGCTLADVDGATQEVGLATPLGINSTTGVAGLTLGGGFGWLSRKHGMTVDNLLSAEVVTADGERLRASADENPDLFWAIRGGGGNFGIVTSFELKLHPVGPQVLSGLIVHPFDDAPEVLRTYRDFVAEAPDELAVWVILRKAPPLPFLPDEWHGREVVVLAAFFGGEMEEGERLLRPLREYGRPLADVVGPHPYAGWQQAFDPLLEPGARNYWKSHDLTQLSDGFLDTVVDHAGRLPSPETEVFIGHLGGAVKRVPADATAYPHRDTEFVMNIHGRWRDEALDQTGVGWARGLFEATSTFATGGVYVNFLTADEGERVRGAYGANYARLADLKRRFDPDNRFRMNQNIQPAVSA